MERKTKKILGLLGLFLVVAITVFAAHLPSDASAVSGATSITDEVNVRVVGDKPRVVFTSPENKTSFREPDVTLSVDYENVQNIRVVIEYTNPAGDVHSYELTNSSVDWDPNTWTYQLDLSKSIYGYGNYKVHVYGTGYDLDTGDDVQNIAEDTIEFSYHTVMGGVTVGEGDDFGKVFVDPGIDPNDQQVYRAEINIYNEKGEIIEEFSPTEVLVPFDQVTFPFAEKGLPSGWYTAEVIAYDEEGNIIDERAYPFYYKAPEVPVPNTGAPFANLNISRADYLATCAVVFGIVVAIGLFFIIRGRKQKATAKRTINRSNKKSH